MKKILILLSLLLSVSTAYGQFRHDRHDSSRGGLFGHRQQQEQHQQSSSHHDFFRDHTQRGPLGGPHASSFRDQKDVACVADWQELWNGCHVRLEAREVRIYKRNGDRLLRGDEVILLHNGQYLVRSGNTWRVYERDGDRTFSSGKEILCWHGGYYCVHDNNMWKVYTEDGDRLTDVWSREYIEQLRNGYFLYERDKRYYVADQSGDRIFDIWGEEVQLMDNGLFRCWRNGRNYFFDMDGNERR